MKNAPNPHEEATIRAFVVRQRRERFLELLSHPKRRRDITRTLAHPNPAWFDSRYIKPVPALNNQGLAKLLRAKGAPATCWVISESGEFDAREMVLLSALEEVVGRDMGAILCCVPGKLAFVESEDGRFILEK